MADEDLPLAVPTSVKFRRKQRKWTQAELAHEAGISTTAVHNLEAGKNGFTDKTLAALARALNCSPAALLTAPEENNSPARGEAAIKKLLRGIADLPEDAINPAWKMISGLLEDAGQSQSDNPHDQSEPSNPRREVAPSR